MGHREATDNADLRVVSETLGEIQRLNQQAISLAHDARFSEALTCASRGAELAREHYSRHPVEADLLNTLASILYEVGDYALADETFRRALDINRQAIGERHPQYARALCNLAVVCQRLSRYDEAESLYLQALEIRRSTIGEGTPIYATNLSDLAKLYESRGRRAAAEPLLKQALEIVRASVGEENEEFARASIALGELRLANGELEEAEHLLQRALMILGRVGGDRLPVGAACLTNLGELCSSMGRLKEAEDFFERANRLLIDIYGDAHPTYVANLSRLGNLYQEKGDFDRAEAIVRQAHDATLRAYGDRHEAYATALTNLAVLRFRIGDLASAEPMLVRALGIRRDALGDTHPDVARGLCDLARVLDFQGHRHEAERHYQSALETFKNTGGENGALYANCLIDIGSMYVRQGRFRDGIEYYQNACRICGRPTDNPVLFATCLNNLANAYDSLGEFEQCERAYREACDILRSTVGDEHPAFIGCLKNLAGVCAARGKHAEALTFFEQTLAADQKRIGSVFAFGSERQRMSFLDTLQDDLYAFLSLVTRDYSGSAAIVATTLDVLLRRKALGAEALLVQSHEILAGKYHHLKPEMERLVALQRQVARATLAGSGEEGRSSHAQFVRTLTSQIDELQSLLSSRIPEMNLGQRLRAVDRRVVSRCLPEGAALVEFIRFEPHRFEAVPAAGEARWGRARYLAFVLRQAQPDDVSMIDLGPAERIDRLIVDFRRGIVSDDGVDFGRTDGALSHQLRLGVTASVPSVLRAALFEPLVSALNGATRVVLAPDGDLTQLPFEVLPGRVDGFLIDDFHFSYVGCGRDVLRHGAATMSAPGRPLLIADPLFDLEAETSQPSGSYARSGDLERSRYHFEPLPGSRFESDVVAPFLGPHERWLGAEALEGRLKRECRSPRVLHIATHGFFLEDQNLRRRHGPSDDVAGEKVPENPSLRSGLVLAGANSWLANRPIPPDAEDGLLTAEDVVGLDLSTSELVVLSACDTGLGEVRVGEGVFGLRRAFALAGARTLVMSLWKVNDVATAMLMECFYRNLVGSGTSGQRGLPRDQALREAQLFTRSITMGELRSRAHPGLAEFANGPEPDYYQPFSHPFYWGAFICQGETAPLTSVWPASRIP